MKNINALILQNRQLKEKQIEMLQRELKILNTLKECCDTKGIYKQQLKIENLVKLYDRSIDYNKKSVEEEFKCNRKTKRSNIQNP